MSTGPADAFLGALIGRGGPAHEAAELRTLIAEAQWQIAQAQINCKLLALELKDLERTRIELLLRSAAWLGQAR